MTIRVIRPSSRGCKHGSADTRREEDGRFSNIMAGPIFKQQAEKEILVTDSLDASRVDPRVKKRLYQQEIRIHT